MDNSQHPCDTHEDLNAVAMIGCGALALLATTLVLAGIRWVFS